MRRDGVGEHHENDWIAFYAALWKHKGNKQGRDMFLPSPAEIHERSLQVRWLESMGFPRRAIVNIMEFDNPSIDRVRQMISRYGPEEAYCKISTFFIKTSDYG